MKREHFFNTNENLDGILKNVQGTLDNLTKLKSDSGGDKDAEVYPEILVKSSCAPSFISQSADDIKDKSGDSQPKPTGKTGVIPNLDESGYEVYPDTLESLAGLD